MFSYAALPAEEEFLSSPEMAIVHTAQQDRRRARVFLSYAHDDSKEANAIHGDVADAKRAAWIDRVALGAGANWNAEIERAVAEADCVVLLLTPDSAKSAYVEKECRWAIGLKKTLLPFVIKPCTPPAYLAATQFEQYSFAKLIAALDDIWPGVDRRIEDVKVRIRAGNVRALVATIEAAVRKPEAPPEVYLAVVEFAANLQEEGNATHKLFAAGNRALDKTPLAACQSIAPTYRHIFEGVIRDWQKRLYPSWKRWLGLVAWMIVPLSFAVWGIASWRTLTGFATVALALMTASSGIIAWLCVRKYSAPDTCAPFFVTGLAVSLSVAAFAGAVATYANDLGVLLVVPSPAVSQFRGLTMKVTVDGKDVKQSDGVTAFALGCQGALSRLDDSITRIDSELKGGPEDLRLEANAVGIWASDLLGPSNSVPCVHTGRLRAGSKVVIRVKREQAVSTYTTTVTGSNPIWMLGREGTVFRVK